LPSATIGAIVALFGLDFIAIFEGKKITSPASTRILLGIMSEDSGYLTLNQMKAYITENNLTNYNKDTLTTGDQVLLSVQSLLCLDWILLPSSSEDLVQ
jgi:nucleoid-associated protein YejK